MTEQAVIELMSSSRNTKEWKDNCDLVKQAFCGEYPDYWWSKIIMSGLAEKAVQGITTITIVTTENLVDEGLLTI